MHKQQFKIIIEKYFKQSEKQACTKVVDFRKNKRFSFSN